VKEFISSHIEAIERAVDDYNIDMEIALIQNFRSFLTYSNTHDQIFTKKLAQHLSGEQTTKQNTKQKKQVQQKKIKRQILAFNKLIEGFAKVLQDQLSNKVDTSEEAFEEFDFSDEEEDTELSEEYKKELQGMCEALKSLKIPSKQK